MTFLRRCLLVCSLYLAVVTSLFAHPYYVSPTGNDTTGTGSIGLPYRTVSKAVSAVVAGDTIYLREGIFNSLKISLGSSKSGSAGLPICLWAYPGEHPIIDFSIIGGTSSDGFSFSGAGYWYFKGIEMRKAPHCAVKISNGDYNIFENCSFHDCGNSGFNIGSSSAGTPYPSNNSIINCDAYRNYDVSTTGANADGFAVKWNVGSGTVFKGCRSWNNTDDGWDLWMCKGSVTIDSCIAFRNGIDSWGAGLSGNNGNGFKLGGSYVATPHTVRCCLSFDNAGDTGRGFDENNNTAGQTLFNCTSFRNLGDNFHFTNTLVSGAHLIQNCISYSGIVNITSGTRNHNSWSDTASYPTAVTSAMASDFISIDTTGITGPRDANGYITAFTFMHLARGSQFIDAGTNVGIAFNGTAPDLGFFESDYSTGVENDNASRIAGFNLYQNYPNPFNPSTVIKFSVARQGIAKLRIMNILGQEVATLFNGPAQPGNVQSVSFNGGSLSSGIYFSVLESGGERQIQKMILMK
jgi:hypothetical protein